ncbi:MAG: glycosyltransferase family 2 protein [Burkholderiales bacterium]
MTPSGTRASVCMATCNGERFIEPQVASILAQLGPQDEIVVSDDHSSDRTLEKIRGFGDRRIRVFKNPRRGVTANFENALAHATGEFVFLSDQDDVWLEGKRATMCDALASHALVLSDCRVADAEGRLLHESYFALLGSRPGLVRNFLRNSYLGCCMAFRRGLLELALPIPAAVAHDYWIGMLGELTGKPLFLARALLMYRRHGATASFAGGKSGRPLATRIGSRVVLAWHLLRRMGTIRARRGG